MPKFIVHLYPLVRVKLKQEIEADSYEDAVDIAQSQGPGLHELFDMENDQVVVEDAEEQQYALVDVVGDTEFKQSRWVHLNTGKSFGDQLYNILKDLVPWAKDVCATHMCSCDRQVLNDAHDLLQQINDDLIAQKGGPA